MELSTPIDSNRSNSISLGPLKGTPGETSFHTLDYLDNFNHSSLNSVDALTTRTNSTTNTTTNPREKEPSTNNGGNHQQGPTIPGQHTPSRAGQKVTRFDLSYLNLERIEEYMKEVSGVRIEDVVLVTESGCENLTHDIPRSI